MRVVLDTSVMIAAFRSRHGASNALLGLGAQRRLVLLATPVLFLEWEDVLKRPEQLAAAATAPAEVDELLRELAAIVEPVSVRFQWRPQLADPSDEFVLEAAVNGRADAIATFNVKHFQAASRRFGLEALTPGMVVRRIGR